MDHLSIKKTDQGTGSMRVLSHYFEMLEAITSIDGTQSETEETWWDTSSLHGVSCVYVSPFHGIHYMERGRRRSFEAYASMTCGTAEPIPCLYADFSSKPVYISSASVIAVLDACGYITPPAIVIATTSDPRGMLCRLRETRGRVLWTDKAEFEDMSVVPCHALSFDRSYATAATKLEPCEIASNLRSIELSGLPYSWDMYISDSEDSRALDEHSCTMVANEATYGMLGAFAKTVCGDSSIHNSIDELLDAYRTIPCTYDGVSRLGNGRSTPNAYQSFRSIGTESNGTSIGSDQHPHAIPIRSRKACTASIRRRQRFPMRWI